MIQQPRKTATLNLRIEPALKRKAEKAAVADNRSVTSLIEKLLLQHFKSELSTGK